MRTLHGNICRTGGAALIGVVVALAVAGCGSQILTPAKKGPAAIASGDLLPRNLRGSPVAPFSSRTARAVAVLFVSTECPISNRYAPEYRRLRTIFEKRGVAFWLVYPNPDETPDAIRQHLKEYDLRDFRVLRDPEHWLVHKSAATVTPEGAVFQPDGTRLYHGRIDNRFAGFGKERASATEHDLQEVLEAVLSGRPIVSASQPAIGCYIAGEPSDRR